MKGRGMRRALGACLLVMALVAAVAGAYLADYCHTDEQAVRDIMAAGGARVERAEDGTLLFLPEEMDGAEPGVVFYPGGKVEYTAYSGLMYELARRGIVGVLPHMPGNLAFLNADFADEVAREAPADMAWYMAGHSLGGVAAGSYAAKALSGRRGLNCRGLILLASYITDDLSGTEARLLSVYGSCDGVLNRERYKNALDRWSADAREVVIEGGNHAFFGCYGAQAGDGEATISNRAQIERTADIIAQWIGEAEEKRA